MDFSGYIFESLLKEKSLTFVLIQVAVFSSLLLSILRCNFRSHQRLPRPPVVEGSLPLIGHWLQMSKDPVAFLRAAHKRHGPIFQVNIFLKKVVYVCDREMQEEFYNAPNTQLSLPGILEDMKLHLMFFDKLGDWWPTMNIVTRRAISLSYPKYTPIIKAGAEEAVRLLSTSRDLDTELTRYVVTTPPRALFNVNSTEPLYADVTQFRNFFRFALFSSYLLPNWLVNPPIRFLARRFIKARRMGEQLLPEISRHFEDTSYDISLLTRGFVDQEFEGGAKLTVDDIKNIILLFTHKTSENTVNFLRSVLLDLTEHPEWMARVREEAKGYVDGFEITDAKALLESKLLQACCMESARLNANVVVSRRKVLPHSTIGGYFIGHCHDIVPCATFFMIESSYHKNSLQYNPDRYLIDQEQYTPRYITTWGSGVHQCPGKVFVLNVAKMFAALVVSNYDIQLRKSKTSESESDKSYFTLSPFVRRTLDNVQLIPVNKNKK